MMEETHEVGRRSETKGLEKRLPKKGKKKTRSEGGVVRDRVEKPRRRLICLRKEAPGPSVEV